MRRRFMTNSDPIPYMYIEALNDNTQISFSNNSYQYKVGDDTEWLKIKDHPIPTVSSGEKVYFKGVLLSIVEGVGQFTVDKEYKVGGDLRTLIYGDNVKKGSPLLSWCFRYLFVGSPIKEIDKDSLPATTLAQGCYYGMFYDCTSLITAPELPATTLANSCYDNMFRGCTSLTSAPELPATTLASNCYYGMFYDCEKLNYIKMLATDISATSCLTNWVNGVSSTGTFVKNPEATWEKYGTSGIPEGWKVVMDGEESGEWGEEITFYFDTTPFGDYYTLTARDGMTWADWVESEYNTIGAEIYEFDGYFAVAWNSLIIANYWNGVSVKPIDKIISEETYGFN